MNALVLGGAECLWSDLEQVPDGWTDCVIAINDSIWAHTGRIDHAVTLHPENLQQWIAKREGPRYYTTWSYREGPDVDRVIENWDVGSSGMLAVAVAVDHLHATSVVLCGVPMDPSPHFWDTKAWTACGVHRKAWQRVLGGTPGRFANVRSCSGWTRDILGAPDFSTLVETRLSQPARSRGILRT